MHLIDYIIFAAYMSAVLGIGYYFFKKNKNREDYYVGSRSISSHHVALSIVATDVGGGFSIGLGGLGFVMGLSGSWLLFTGLVGAWLSAVFIIPRIKKVDLRHGMLTYPDFLRLKYDDKVALAAAVISGIGYLGFTGAQVLAGAKLVKGSLITGQVFGIEPLQLALYVMGIVIIGYTVLGGLKAVIFTDTIQWIILLSGLSLLAIPFALANIGGYSALRASLPDEFFNLTNISPTRFANWMITIIPIWFVAMTVYQRIYACRNVKEARKAWYIAGLFEYPLMAFTGVFLGMCAKVIFPRAEAEMGIPLLIRDVLPMGATGMVVASYFSAIMSTADSCLLASSGNIVNDIIERYILKGGSEKQIIRVAQIATLIIGLLAIVIAASYETVIEIILYTYAFMVSGLFVPTLGAYFWKKSHPTAAFWSMISGGSLTLFLIVSETDLPLGLHASFYGIPLSALVLILLSLLLHPRRSGK